MKICLICEERSVLDEVDRKTGPYDYDVFYCPQCRTYYTFHNKGGKLIRVSSAKQNEDWQENPPDGCLLILNGEKL